MKVQTTRFGEIDIEEAKVLDFPEGLPGFAGHRFTILHNEEQPIVEWLQSVTEPDVALMMIDPEHLLVPYRVEPKDEDMLTVRPEPDCKDEILCRVIIRSSDQPGQLFVNFFAPILINVERRVAMQIPLVGTEYSVRALWPPPELVESLKSGN